MDLILGQEEEKIEKRDFDILIIGAGAAGLSAAIYSVRSGLSTIVIDGSTPGGLTAEAPLVENYLGFTEIVGTQLANLMVEHARNYVKIIDNCKVLSIKKEGNFKVATEKGLFSARGIIFATGTKHKHLGVEGEAEYYGKGVSYCSTCDGYLFKNKKVLVIGGGNSGAIAGISLKNIAKEVKIFEFMPKYMCEDAYVKQIQSMGIEYKRNVQVTKIKGDGKSVRSVVFKDRSTGEEKEELFDGIFIYVGLTPQSDVARDMGVKLNEKGFIQIDRNCRTNLDLVYATGDVAGSFAQIIVAASDGAIAANSAWLDLSKR
ncbi:MAG: FAD-dependent oxidoreductase [Candidatus Thermoplasmatota archaeon]|jgi:thioredoxin reductase (NADPH)|nr:FAD-dependent oxidoreductase [Candidatus Thermoplasmatota archaeon]MCL5681409.1 FAD-dependent oxidoreductase [Candidatus Thermoplasmatota archaeon]